MYKQLIEIANNVMRIAIANLKRDKELTPVLMVGRYIDNAWMFAVIEVSMKNAREKDQLAALMCQVASRSDALIFISDVWIRKMKHHVDCRGNCDDMCVDWTKLEKTEAITMIIQSRNGKQGYTQHYERISDEIRLVGEIKVIEGDLSGRLCKAYNDIN